MTDWYSDVDDFLEDHAENCERTPELVQAAEEYLTPIEGDSFKVSAKRTELWKKFGEVRNKLLREGFWRSIGGE